MARAANLGVRTSYPPDSRRTLLVSRVLDCISAGILIYVGFVELLAHEISFDAVMLGEFAMLLSLLFLSFVSVFSVALGGRHTGRA